MCPGAFPIVNESSNGACRNLTSVITNQNVWSSYPYHSDLALQIHLWKGTIQTQGGTRANNIYVYAFCK